jgi:hypothetical protein
VRCCILEEYCEPFSKKWRRTGLTYREILRLGEDICKAVTECMEHGIMHLDIQPKNILMAEDGTFKLCDFSSAEFEDTRCKVYSEFRHGTLAYLAPEAYKDGKYSEQSEMYSLGILLYCILNGGMVPFTKEMALPTAIEKRLEGASLPPLKRHIPGLAEVVMKACAYHMDERYRSIAELQKTLEELRKNLPEDLAEEKLLYWEMRTDALEPRGVLFDSEQAATSLLETIQMRDEGEVPPGGATGASSSGGASGMERWLDTIDPEEEQARRRELEWQARREEEQARRREEHARREEPSGGLLEMSARREEPSVHAPQEQHVTPSEVEFSAIAPKKLVKGETSIIDLVMYEEAYRKVVDQIIRDAEGETQEKQSGVLEVAKGSRIRIELTSPDLQMDDNVEEGIWRGKYLAFSLAVSLPEDYKKHQILLIASVYTDGVPLTKLRFTVKCFSLFEQKLKMIREDVLSGFVSYASQDRERVASRVQGMLKARPDMNLFFDVDSLRSGDDWERILRAEIDRRDVLFLFWSRAAKESEWVAREWKYALNTKGSEVIEPVPMDPPDQCPPPEELRGKHFNDRFLFMTHGN